MAKQALSSDSPSWGTAPSSTSNASPYEGSLQQMYQHKHGDSQPLSERVLLSRQFECFTRLAETSATIAFISMSLREHAPFVLFAIALGFAAIAHATFTGLQWWSECKRNTQIRAADESRRVAEQEVAAGAKQPSRPAYRPADRSFIARVVLALPVVNYVAGPLVQEDNTSHPSVAISWCSLHTFPQYVICLCYALDGRPLSAFWCAAMAITTLYTLLGPFHALARHDSHHGGYWHVFCTCFIWFLPIVLLELVHFFPLFFAYYYYHSISKAMLINYLLVFNVPKSLFLFLRMTNDRTKDDQSHSQFLLGLFPPALVPLLIVPLVPSVLLLTHVIGVPNWGSMPDGFVELLRAKCAAYRWNLTLLALYLWLAYGGLLHLVLTQHSPGLVVNVSVWATVTLTVVVLVQHLTFKLSNFRIMPMWRQDGSTVSMYGEFQCRGGVRYSLKNQQSEANEDLISKQSDLESGKPS